MIAYQEAGATVVVNERGDVAGCSPRLALCMPYYRNPGMLRRHMVVWRDEWTPELKRDIEVIIVDDGSPDEPARDALDDRSELPPIALYRVKADIPWHQHGARNLAAHVATAPYLLMTDIDHVAPASTLAEALSLLPLRGRDVVTFGRVDAPATPAWQAGHWTGFERTKREDGSLKPHVNSFVIARRHYWRLGGYDESFCGIYGCDQEFRTRLWKQATERHLEHAPLIRVGREVIADASTRGLKRKSPAYKAAKKAVNRDKRLMGETKLIRSLEFEWEKIL